MTPCPHTIAQVDFNFAFGTRSQVMNDAGTLPHFIKTRLVPCMDSVMADWNGEDTVIRIDRLDIDLGRVTYDEMEARLSRKLRKALLDMTSGAGAAISPEPPGRVRRLTGQQAQLELLGFYLSTGRLPWRAEKYTRGDLTGILESLLQRAPRALADFLRQQTASDNPVLPRLVRQFGADLMRRLAARLSPAGGEGIGQWISLLSDPTPDRSLPQPDQWTWGLWEAALRRLLQPNGTAMPCDDLVASVLKQAVTQSSGMADEIRRRLAGLQDRRDAPAPGAQIQKVVRRFSETVSVQRPFPVQPGDRFDTWPALRLRRLVAIEDLRIAGFYRNKPADLPWADPGKRVARQAPSGGPAGSRFKPVLERMDQKHEPADGRPRKTREQTTAARRLQELSALCRSYLEHGPEHGAMPDGRLQPGRADIRSLLIELMQDDPIRLLRLLQGISPERQWFAYRLWAHIPAPLLQRWGRCCEQALSDGRRTVAFPLHADGRTVHDWVRQLSDFAFNPLPAMRFLQNRGLAQPPEGEMATATIPFMAPLPCILGISTGQRETVRHRTLTSGVRISSDPSTVETSDVQDPEKLKHPTAAPCPNPTVKDPDLQDKAAPARIPLSQTGLGPPAESIPARDKDTATGQSAAGLRMSGGNEVPATVQASPGPGPNPHEGSGRGSSAKVAAMRDKDEFRIGARAVDPSETDVGPPAGAGLARDTDTASGQSAAGLRIPGGNEVPTTVQASPGPEPNPHEGTGRGSSAKVAAMRDKDEFRVGARAVDPSETDVGPPAGAGLSRDTDTASGQAVATGRVPDENAVSALVQDAPWKRHDTGRRVESGRHTTMHENNAPRPGTQPVHPAGLEDLPPIESIHVDNAGMVLVAPYLPRLFGMLDLLSKGRFKDPPAAERGVHLLEYLVCERSSAPEFQLFLNKVMCGVSGGVPLPPGIDISEKEAAAVDGLIRAVISHWKIIGNTSPEGLRSSFLQRTGELTLKEAAWHLKVHGRAFDMLLDQLPWSFATIKHPWMQRVLYVHWR